MQRTSLLFTVLARTEFIQNWIIEKSLIRGQFTKVLTGYRETNTG